MCPPHLLRMVQVTTEARMQKTANVIEVELRVYLFLGLSNRYVGAVVVFFLFLFNFSWFLFIF